MESIRTVAGLANPSKPSSIFCYIIIPIIFASITLTVLLASSGDCDYSIRLWLWVYTGVLYGYALVYIIALSFSLKAEGTQRKVAVGCCAVMVSLLISVFMFVWVIIGNFWLYASEGCTHDWTSGYVTTLIILIFWYIGIFFVCCNCCLLCIGIFVTGSVWVEAAQEATQLAEQQLTQMGEQQLRQRAEQGLRQLVQRYLPENPTQRQHSHVHPHPVEQPAEEEPLLMRETQDKHAQN
mmetsp:Transcript_34663/g.60949  ORF Transcript_34663/g.60949 Transcript_34663/m.60949 type:complete len:238 (+) Transcript_34663:676-1389(+)